MARVPKQVVVGMEGFFGGLNKDADRTRLLPVELSDALNVNIGLRGEAQKRGGFVRHDSNLAGSKIISMFPWKDETGVEYLIAIGQGGTIWRTNNAARAFADTGQDLGAVWNTAAAYPVGYAAAKGNLYISTRRSGIPTKKFTGTAWSNVSAVPQGQHLRWRFEQLFVANLPGATSQMKISVPLQPENFVDTPAVIDFESEDGTEIRGLISSGDDLMVFKDHAIHILTGKVRADFAKYRLDSLRGTVSPKTVKQIRGLVIFFDRDTGVWSWDGQAFTLISEKLNNYILDNHNYNRAWVAAGHVRRDQYYLTVPWGESQMPNRTFVYSTLTNTWTEWDIGWTDAQRHMNREFIAAPKNLGGIYEGPRGWKDNGQPYQVRIRTPWFQPAGPGAISRLRRVESSMSASNATVNVSLRHEYTPKPILTRTFVANNPDRTGEVDLIKNLDGWGKRADAHQIEYTTKDDKGFRLNGVQMVFTVNEDMLGERGVNTSTPAPPQAPSGGPL